MGLFCVNLHFKTSDHDALAAALDRRGIRRRRVLPAKGGWTSLYEEEASQQDDRRIRELGENLSRDLQVPGIAFLVHDSDIACYWLYDNGRLLDEYNSYPDYFADTDGPPTPSGGQPNVLVRYCRAGVREEELAGLLSQELLFAEGTIERLAQALGIEVERALSDFRNIAEDGGPNGGFDDDGGDDGSGDDQDDDGGPSILSLPSGLADPDRPDDPESELRFPKRPSQFPKGWADQLTQMFGVGQGAGEADPQAIALVEAAARGDREEIDRLLTEGVPVNAEAPAPSPGGQPLASLAQMVPGGLPKFAMTPLLTAVSHKQRAAVELLLDRGADPNHVHPVFGTPVHVAAAEGNQELLRLLLDRGGSVTARNRQGQTPLQVLVAGRATVDRLAQAQAMIKSMGIAIPGFPKKLSQLTPPTDGWDACEQLLKERGGTG